MKPPPLDPRLTGDSGFKNFLYLTWKAIGLPDPTPVQYDIADFLQHGKRRRGVEGFRGVGKSYITGAYIVWRGLLDPYIKVMLVSASKQRADDLSTFILQIIRAHGPLTAHLLPTDEGRNSKIAFDFGCATNMASGSASVVSRGVTSSNTGSRADIIICDDVCSWSNSQTQVMRDKLRDTIKEFDGAILKPGGETIYLFTLQTEDDPMLDLPDRGFELRMWPARVPTKKWMDQYGEFLAPMIRELSETESVGAPTDPKRFNDLELTERELTYGRSLFALQFLLDHTLADADRYPLKLNDLIVTDLDLEVCPEKLVWAGDSRYAWGIELPCVGFNGDRYFKPWKTVGEMVPYAGTVMAIDPSGRGSDETTWCVVKSYGGQLFLIDIGANKGGFEDSILQEIAECAKRNKVNHIVVEENYGGGMFTSLLTPVLAKTYPCGIEEIRHSTQKERRICDTLEPIMNSHKLIVDRQVILKDLDLVKTLPPEEQRIRMLMWQMSRITRERGALRHDDRLDVVAMACAYWSDAMARDTDRQMADMDARRHEEDLRVFLQNAIGGRPAPPPPMWASPR